MMADPQRPMYETREDRAREAAVIEKIERHLDAKAQKCPMRYRADYALLRGNEVLRFVEVKVRSECYDPYWIALDKWMMLERLSLYALHSSLIVVQWPDRLACVEVSPTNRKRLAIWGGRKDRADWQDVEPMVCIPLARFDEIG